MKRLLLATALCLSGFVALTGCSHVHHRDDDDIGAERRELMQEDRARRLSIHGECATTYNNCIARCDEILSPMARSSCISDCSVARAACLGE